MPDFCHNITAAHLPAVLDAVLGQGGTCKLATPPPANCCPTAGHQTTATPPPILDCRCHTQSGTRIYPLRSAAQPTAAPATATLPSTTAHLLAVLDAVLGEAVPDRARPLVTRRDALARLCDVLSHSLQLSLAGLAQVRAVVAAVEVAAGAGRHAHAAGAAGAADRVGALQGEEGRVWAGGVLDVVGACGRHVITCCEGCWF